MNLCMYPLSRNFIISKPIWTGHGGDCLYSQGLGHGGRKIMGSRPTWTTLRDPISRSFLQNKRPFLNILRHFWICLQWEREGWNEAPGTSAGGAQNMRPTSTWRPRVSVSFYKASHLPPSTEWLGQPEECLPSPQSAIGAIQQASRHPAETGRSVARHV